MMKESAIQTLQPGFKLQSKDRTYEIIEILGSGSFGITYLAKADVSIGNIKTSMQFAIKEHFVSASCYRGNDGTTVCAVPTAKLDVTESRTDFITEAKRLKKLCLKSRNIVSVNETFEANDTAYYVMEYLDGGTPSKCSEKEAISIILQVASALDIIHNEHVLHLDLKPDNIVLKTNDKNETYPVLIDFGISKHFDSNGNPTSRLKAKGASPGYAPQEQHTEVNAFSPKYDIYALGAVLFFLCIGKNPPDAFNISPNQYELRRELDGKVSSKVEHTILGAMMPSAFERTPTIAQFCTNLIGTDSTFAQKYYDSPLDLDDQSQLFEDKKVGNKRYSSDDHSCTNTQPINLGSKENFLEKFINSIIIKKPKKAHINNYDIYDYAKIEQHAEQYSFCAWHKWLFPLIIVGTQHYDSTYTYSEFCKFIYNSLDKCTSKSPQKIRSFLIRALSNFHKNNLRESQSNIAPKKFSVALLCLTDTGALCINCGVTKIFHKRNDEILYEADDQVGPFFSEEEKLRNPSRNITESAVGDSHVYLQNKIIPYKKGDQFILISGEGRNTFTKSGWHKILKSTSNDFELMNAMISQVNSKSDSKLGYGFSIITTTCNS